MIPLQLRISGFLSYREPAELDFTAFDLACISGRNGAGKSALLDAITFALFGQARRRDDALINTHAASAEVALTFQYEGETFRVQRTIPRGKTTTLEFQLRDDGGWRPLTERTLRETQARIEKVLRLDYETFVTASFFLQGRADQFAQQNPGRRKEVLGSILGLEVWESYKARASEQRRVIETSVSELENRIQEANAELSDEEARQQRLRELTVDLDRLSTGRAAQEAALDGLRKTRAAIEEQSRLQKLLEQNLERSRARLADVETRISAKMASRDSLLQLGSRADEISRAYEGWQEAQRRIEGFDEIAARYGEEAAGRPPLLAAIAAEQARLEQERRTLQARSTEISNNANSLATLKEQLAALEKDLQQLDLRLAERQGLEANAQQGRSRQAELKTRNLQLKAEMDDLRGRIEKLTSTRGAECPLCGQALDKRHRAETIATLEHDGKIRAKSYRDNTKELGLLAETLARQEAELRELTEVEKERVEKTAVRSRLGERAHGLEESQKEWSSSLRQRLEQITAMLTDANFAPGPRKELDEIERRLAALGYDSAAHDNARRQRAQLAAAPAEFSRLQTAREVQKQIEDELRGLDAELASSREELASLEHQYRAVTEQIRALTPSAPDLLQAEASLRELREQENQVRDEVGAARQRVEILDMVRVRASEYSTTRDELQGKVVRLRTLERAFGREGVPALLIEEALPQIEAKANEVLDRLSDGQLSVRFVTLAAYKDKKRDDRRETLDILIGDGAGVREYEMYSGGEAFRVNFAIRLALSEILAQRKGARLQTLVIDEGFGSQDVQGRQRLIEAINLVRSDFAKIIVITHLEELKDAFPTRIEVEKSERGSFLQVS